jgi:hypothetical protein
VLRLLVTANVVPISPIRVSLMMEAVRSSETPVLTRVTRRNVPKDGIPHAFKCLQRNGPNTVHWKQEAKCEFVL